LLMSAPAPSRALAHSRCPLLHALWSATEPNSLCRDKKWIGKGGDERRECGRRAQWETPDLFEMGTQGIPSTSGDLFLSFHCFFWNCFVYSFFDWPALIGSGRGLLEIQPPWIPWPCLPCLSFSLSSSPTTNHKTRSFTNLVAVGCSPVLEGLDQLLHIAFLRKRVHLLVRICLLCW
jgi:hypothetical protein